MKKAFITGITGQDGSYLAELLLEKGYEVHGLVRPVSLENQEIRLSRIQHIIKNERVKIYLGDVREYPTLWRLIAKIEPHEVYHLAGITHVGVATEDEFGTYAVNTQSTHYLLSAIKELNLQCRFYFSSSAEIFGQAEKSPQNEKTPLQPNSPYGVSKLESFHQVKLFRDIFGVFGCSGICFNHESPRRGTEFVTRKISMAVAKIKRGEQKELRLGNLEVKRDWGFAGDYVEAMWRMLQSEKADDYVIGSGEHHTIKEFVELAFRYAGLDYKKYVVIDKDLFRPTEIAEKKADISKISGSLRWKPKTSFSDLVRMMVDADLKR